MALKTVPECKRAAETLALSYANQANTPFRPKGCYVDGLHTVLDVYFNFHTTGSAHEQAVPICRDVSTISPTRGGQTTLPTVAPSAAWVSPNYVLVGKGSCRGSSGGRLNARVKLVSDEAACADACDSFECEGYSYVHSGAHSSQCRVYGEKMAEGLRPHMLEELATTVWKGFQRTATTIRSSSGTKTARCMLRGTHKHIHPVEVKLTSFCVCSAAYKSCGLCYDVHQTGRELDMELCAAQTLHKHVRPACFFHSDRASTRGAGQPNMQAPH